MWRVIKVYGLVYGMPLMAVAFGYYLWGAATCKAYGNSTERPTRYDVISGCMVKLEGKTTYIPRSEIRTQE